MVNKACPVGQHPVQHDRGLAGKRDLGFAHAGASRQAHPQLFRVEPLTDWVRMTLAAS